MSGFGLIVGVIIRIGGEENQRDLIGFQNAEGGFYTIHFTLQRHVHQHQIGSGGFDAFQGIFATWDNARNVVTELIEHHGDIGGNDDFVFDDEDFGVFHV